MSKLKERILFMMLGAMLTLAVLVLIGWLQVRTPARIACTQATLMLFPMASSNYFSTFGRWPQSIADFSSNASNMFFIVPPVPTNDAWGRRIVYESFDSARAYGRVLSYGRDGKPGGAGPDADIEFRFGR